MPKRGVIRVATCQFAVSGSIRRNAAQMRRQIKQAKRLRADVVHFSETALTGYAGANFESWDGFDWDTLRVETEGLQELCGLNSNLGVGVRETPEKHLSLGLGGHGRVGEASQRLDLLVALRAR